MSALYWMVSTADPRCGDEGTLPEEMYYSEKYNKTADFLKKGEVHQAVGVLFSMKFLVISLELLFIQL